MRWLLALAVLAPLPGCFLIQSSSGSDAAVPASVEERAEQGADTAPPAAQDQPGDPPAAEDPPAQGTGSGGSWLAQHRTQALWTAGAAALAAVLGLLRVWARAKSERLAALIDAGPRGEEPPG